MDTRQLSEMEPPATNYLATPAISFGKQYQCSSGTETWLYITLAITYCFQVGLAYHHDSNTSTPTRRWIKSLLFIPFTFVNWMIYTTRAILLYHMLTTFMNRMTAHTTTVRRDAETSLELPASLEPAEPHVEEMISIIDNRALYSIVNERSREE